MKKKEPGTGGVTAIRFPTGVEWGQIMGCILALTLGTGMTREVNGQETIEGSWEGALNVAGSQLGIVVQFSFDENQLEGTIDIPQQGAAGLALSNLSYEPPRVNFTIANLPGEPTFSGQYENNEIIGSFSQGGLTGTFVLTRREASPEEPDEELPYTSEEVEFANGDVVLAGTLTIPEGTGPFPAVVTISGSGPQNRDEELFGFRPFRVIADRLTRNGVAVLRYDDRGVGGSSGNVQDATSEDFANDVRAAVALLSKRPDIDGRRIGLIGHSEGGIVAPMVAADASENIAFIVMLAGPAVPGADILLAQGELIVRANGGGDDAVRQQRDLQERIFEVVRAGDGWEELETSLRQQAREQLAALPAQQRAAIGDQEAFIQAQMDAQLGFAKSKWFEFFLDYDPGPALARVTAPILALFGELDLQVPPGLNRDRMEVILRQAGHRDFTTAVLPRANHLFIPATTGSPTEYSTLPKEFVPELLPLITEWIVERTR